MKVISLIKEMLEKKEEITLGKDFKVLSGKSNAKEIESRLDSLLVMSNMLGYEVKFANRSYVIKPDAMSRFISIESEEFDMHIRFHIKKQKLKGASISSLIKQTPQRSSGLVLGGSKDILLVIKKAEGILGGEENEEKLNLIF